MGGTKFLVQWEEHPTHLATRLGYLLEHQSLVDVTLMCNTHTLKVHRSVLAACSPYFERQLGSHPLIVLKDMKFSVLKSLVEFMYCGETSVAEENLNPLMEAAKFFEVKGLSSMTKEAISDQTSPTQNTTPSINGISPSGRGGRRPGAGRGRRTATIPMTHAHSNANTNPPTAESAQILLSLSGNPSNPGGSNSNATTPQAATGRQPGAGRLNQQRLTKVFTQDGTIIDVATPPKAAAASFIRNGTIVSDSTTPTPRSTRGGFEPRRRGRRRNPANLMYNRNNLNSYAYKESEASRIAVENLKKEMDGIQSGGDHPLNPLWHTGGGNTVDKSPLLASLLSKAEKFENSKLKNENQEDVCESTTDQETLVYQVDGEGGVSSSNAKYLEALKEAGLPTDVPILIDNGDGNYVTLTEDLLMNVMEGKEEFQFQVTEGTAPGDVADQEVGEGIVLQDGSIVMDKKTVDKNNVVVSSSSSSRPVRQFVVKEKPAAKSPVPQPSEPPKDTTPTPTTNRNAGKRSVQEIINEAMLESLKTDSTEAELDPDAVILIEETENSKFEKYVVSSKEINALKALNEEMQLRKKLAKDGATANVSTSPLANVDLIGGNTKIAEVKLTIGKNKSTKSILSQVLECVQGIERMKQQATTTPPQTPPKAVANAVTASDQDCRVMSKVKGQPQLVQLEFIDGDGERIEGYQVEGTMISDKRFSAAGESSTATAAVGAASADDKATDNITIGEVNELNSTDDLTQELNDLDKLTASSNTLQEESNDKQFVIQEQHISQKEFEEIIDESVGNADVISAKHDDDMLNLLTIGNDLPEEVNESNAECSLVEQEPDIGGMTSTTEDQGQAQGTEKTVQNEIKGDDLLIDSFNELSKDELMQVDDKSGDLCLDEGAGGVVVVVEEEEEGKAKEGDDDDEEEEGTKERLLNNDDVKEVVEGGLCLEDEQSSIVENGLVLDDDTNGKPLSVEQALEVMMGDAMMMKKMMKKSGADDGDGVMLEEEEEEVKEEDEEEVSSQLHLALESECSQQETTRSSVLDQEEYQVVYISEKDELVDCHNSQEEIVIMAPTTTTVHNKLDVQGVENSMSPKRRLHSDSMEGDGGEEEELEGLLVHSSGKRLKLSDEEDTSPLLSLANANANADDDVITCHDNHHNS